MKLSEKYLSDQLSELKKAHKIISNEFNKNQKIVDKIYCDDLGLSLISMTGGLAVILKGFDGIIKALEEIRSK